MKFSIFLNPKAKDYLQSLISKKGIEDGAILFGLKMYGCNGFGYTLDIESSKNSLPDETFIFSGVKFIVKKEFQDKLNNIIIDYKREGLNQLLSYDNPNVSYECGCGESVTFK